MRDDWRRDALCAQVDPELFFPEKGELASSAKRICGSADKPNCPVREQCLDFALWHVEREGLAAERELDNDPERKARERERLIRWAFQPEGYRPMSDGELLDRITQMVRPPANTPDRDPIWRLINEHRQRTGIG